MVPGVTVLPASDRTPEQALPMKAEISYSEPFNENAYCVGGAFRLPENEWRGFIALWDSPTEASLEPEEWGITNAILHCPESAPRSKIVVEQFLGHALGVTDWREVQGPNSEQLAILGLMKKRRQFQDVMATFVNRSGLYIESHEACVVQVTDVCATDDGMRATVIAVPEVQLVGKINVLRHVDDPAVAYLEEDCPFGKQWSIGKSWNWFYFSER
jgi:hypothetical protein